jgi:hypothetical protein
MGGVGVGEIPCVRVERSKETLKAAYLRPNNFFVLRDTCSLDVPYPKGAASNTSSSRSLGYYHILDSIKWAKEQRAKGGFVRPRHGPRLASTSKFSVRISYQGQTDKAVDEAMDKHSNTWEVADHISVGATMSDFEPDTLEWAKFDLVIVDVFIPPAHVRVTSHLSLASEMLEETEVMTTEEIRDLPRGVKNEKRRSYVASPYDMSSMVSAHVCVKSIANIPTGGSLCFRIVDGASPYVANVYTIASECFEEVYSAKVRSGSNERVLVCITRNANPPPSIPVGVCHTNVPLLAAEMDSITSSVRRILALWILLRFVNDDEVFKLLPYKKKHYDLVTITPWAASLILSTTGSEALELAMAANAEKAYNRQASFSQMVKALTLADPTTLKRFSRRPITYGELTIPGGEGGEALTTALSSHVVFDQYQSQRVHTISWGRPFVTTINRDSSVDEDGVETIVRGGPPIWSGIVMAYDSLIDRQVASLRALRFFVVAHPDFNPGLSFVPDDLTNLLYDDRVAVLTPVLYRDRILSDIYTEYAAVISVYNEIVEIRLK